MKIPCSPCALVLALFVSAGTLHSESVTSVPLASITVEIPAGSLAVPSVTTFSLPLRETTPASFQGIAAGRITEVTANTISNTNAGWAAGALSQSGAPWFIRITSGSATGRTLQISSSTANTSSTLTVLNEGTDLTGLGIVTGPGGDTYEIFPGDTLLSLFGDSTLGGTSAASADVVRLHNGTTWSEYYYHSGANQWRVGAVPVNQNSVVVRPDAGIIFYRRGGTPLTLTLLGAIPTTPIRSVVNNTGVTFLGNVFPVDQTLSSAGFHALPGWVNNTGLVTNADKVVIWERFSYTYYNYNQAYAQWRSGAVPVNQSNVLIRAGTPVIIERPGTVSGVTTLLRNLPYSLNP